MYSDFLKKNYTSQASFVAAGYGQVEPNHLSARHTSQIYAQLPAAADIDILENGQFAKYDYAAENGGEVNFEGAGEWMLVFNEIKLYRDGQSDCEFAMVKDNYQARIYSPYDWENSEEEKQARFYNGTGVDSADGSITFDNDKHTVTFNEKTYSIDDVTAAADPYEIHYNEDPFHFLGDYKERRMAEGTTMVPRLFKTNVGDIFTTNTINAEPGSLKLGDPLTPGEKGILEPGEGDMTWQVVRVYTMPDGQPGVKIQRIK